MALSLLFVVDPLPKLKEYKDTSVAMMREAARRGHAIFACTLDELSYNGVVRADVHRLHITQQPEPWYEDGGSEIAQAGRLGLGDERAQQAHEAQRIVEVREMARVLEELQSAARHQLVRAPAVPRMAVSIRNPALTNTACTSRLTPKPAARSPPPPRRQPCAA